MPCEWDGSEATLNDCRCADPELFDLDAVIAELGIAE